MATVKDFAQAMRAIAARTGYQPSDWELGVYQSELEPLGWDAVLRALREIYLGLEGNGRFPSVNAIKAKLGVKAIEDRDEARDLAGVLYGAMCRFGTQKEGPPGQQDYRARAKVGELGWALIERNYGGWARFSDYLEGVDESTAKAQLRGEAEVLIAKARAGTLALPSPLPPAGALPPKIQEALTSVEASTISLSPAAKTGVESPGAKH